MKAEVGNPIRKLILIYLADTADEKGCCWPSYGTMARCCEASRSTVIRHVSALEESGFLKVEIRKGGLKGNHSNMIHLTIEEGGGSTVTPGVVSECNHPSVTVTPGVVSECDHPSVTVTPGGSVTVTPRTYHSFEPTNEPIKKNIYTAKNLVGEFKSKNTTTTKLIPSVDDWAEWGWPHKPDPDCFDAWISMRREKRYSVTWRTLETMAGPLTELFMCGIPLETALDFAEQSGWCGIEAKWVFDRLGTPAQARSWRTANSSVSMGGSIYENEH
nr:helix-turn-helix domain-containing protein [Sinobacterium caligoides]